VTSVLTRILPNKIGWETYLHLVWLVFLLFQPFFDPSWTRLGWAYTALMVALFLPVYFWTWTQKGHRMLWGVAGMALLGAVFVHLNSGSSAFFIYAASAAAFSGPARFAWRVVGSVWALLVISAFASPIPWPYIIFAFLPSLIMTAAVGGINIFEAEKTRANAKLRLAHEEIEHLATIAERERIARDLHDLLGHTLSVITLKSELASKLAPSDVARASREMEEVAQVSRQTLKEVREAVRGYRARGFMGELTSAKMALETAGVRFEYYAEPLTLTPAQESTLALALREAVTNVVRHAQATRCTVRLVQNEEGVQLEVEDDGRGGDAPDGAGLCGMRERVLVLGGSLKRGGEGGTRLVLTLPFRKRAPTLVEAL
jgi:two-component system sensor histidine kinase DesK